MMTSRRYRDFCVECDKHVWFNNGKCEECRVNKMWNIITMFVVILLVVLGLFFFFYSYRQVTDLLPKDETTYEENIGYAGSPFQRDEDTTYIELYTDPGDIDAMNRFVSSEGTLVWENSNLWTSTGYYPKKGDLVRVKVMRQWKNDKLVHGYSVTEFISHPKPFALIGQEIKPKQDFYAETKLDKNVVEPIVILDANKDVVRVKMANGKIHTYGWGWFTVSEIDIPASRYWVVGNQFKVGDVVCLNRDNDTDLPKTTVITDVSDGDHVKVSGYNGGLKGWIGFENYEKCVK